MRAERVADNLNRSLHELFDSDERIWLLGEDVLDPYGGAFKITRGLSTRHPDRVLTTPLSEGAIVGAASGLALAGDRAIVEIMFSDFMTLAFDQLLNFASKCGSMFGRPQPMSLLVRCPTGGRRGYGPTHSQSLQKHFIGIPGLSVYELSPFRDNRALLAEAMGSGRPGVLFEDKVLYTQRMFTGGRVCELFTFEPLDPTGSTARVFLREVARTDCVLIVPGGLVDRTLGAARRLLVEEEIACQVLVPTVLHPLDIEPMLPILRQARGICVVEDASAGGTWGAEVAHTVHTRLWGSLSGPVRLVHGGDSIVPTATHLERDVLVREETVVRAVKEALTGG